MNLRNYLSIILAGAMTLSALSCKKDDETTYKYLSGNLNFEVPGYVEPGAKVTMTASGVKHPEGEKLGYTWRVSPTMPKADSTDNPVFTHTFSDTLKTYTIYCTAYSKGYTSASATQVIQVVKGGLDQSITGTGIKKNDAHITYDGADYYYTSINGTDWFRNNLAATDGGTPYRGFKAMSDVLGRFYSYEDAVKACPEGWRLPTDQDWIDMAKAFGAPASLEPHSQIPAMAAKIMANASYNGTLMWEYWPAVGEITNATGLSVIPAGYANLGTPAKTPKETEFNEGTYPGAYFNGANEYAAFWTADRVEGEEGMAYYRYIIANQPFISIEKGDTKTFGASVRCVRK